MPLYHFVCGGPEHHRVRRIFSSEAAAALKVCPTCATPMERTPHPPTAQVVERLDNGWMTKAIERPADAERIFKERADKDPRNDPE